MICVLQRCNKRLISSKYIAGIAIRSLSTVENVTQALQEVSPERKERVMRLCSRYTPSRTTFSLKANDYLAIKKKLKFQRVVAAIPVYFASIITFSATIPELFPWVLQEAPMSIESLGIEAIDPSFVGTSMAVLGTFVTMITAFSIYPSLALRWMGYKVAYDKRDEDFKRRLDFYRCTDSVEVGFSDDYHGDKIQDLTDYRYWIRVQQIKHQNSASAKASTKQ